MLALGQYALDKRQLFSVSLQSNGNKMQYIITMCSELHAKQLHNQSEHVLHDQKNPIRLSGCHN